MFDLDDVNLEWIVFTKNTIFYFRNLLGKELEKINIRVFVKHPGTMNADFCVSFCAFGLEKETDIAIVYKNFTIYIAVNSKENLQNAEVDFHLDQYSGQFIVKAPNLKKISLSSNESLAYKIQEILKLKINRALASHGGMVSLVEVVEEGSVVILQFSGACRGCGMVDQTLQIGIEQTLKEHFPQIREVRDITNHTLGKNPYYS